MPLPLPRKHFLVFLIVGLMFLTAFRHPDFDQDNAALQSNSPSLQVEEGRPLTIDDWSSHLPLAGATVVVVIIVDAIFLAQIPRYRRKQALEN